MGCSTSSNIQEPEQKKIITPIPMEYRLLSNTGIKVSVISYGSQLDNNVKQNTLENVKKAWSLGINLFDVTDYQGNGEAQNEFGNAFKILNIPREDLVISTKLVWGAQFADKSKMNQKVINRKYIKETVKNTLKRLQMDYIDIVFCHYFDRDTPLQEVIEIASAFTELIQEGYVHYWGTSEWSAENIYEIREVCSEKKLIKPLIECPHYNMFAREKLELEYIRLFDKSKISSIVQSTLANGILSGKQSIKGIPSQNKWDALNGFFHLKKIWDNYFTPQKRDVLTNIIKSLELLANELGLTLSQLAISWVISNKDVSSAIITCSQPKELEESIQSIHNYKKITPEIIRKIDNILGNTPDQGVDFKSFAPLPSRR